MIMSFRSMMFALALGAAGSVGFVGQAAATGGGGGGGGGGFVCTNKLDINVVECVGSIAVLPITIDVHDVRALNDNELNVLSDDLNHVSILDGGILNKNKILNDAYLTVLDDFLNKFDIDVTHNEIDVCTSVLGVLLCK
jgi:hypothetical protein